MDTIKKRSLSTRGLTYGARLKAFLQVFKRDDRVLVVIVADPDSMASAFAVKRLLSRRVEEVTIAHPNEIKRLNNLAMRDLLKIPLQRLKSVKRSEYTKFVLLDSQPTHLPELSAFSFDAVIDHHPVTEGWEAGFVDIRPEYGATSSMLTEYLKSAKIRPAVLLATALFYGIKTDTQNFAKKAIMADVLCFQHLFKLINQNLLGRIETADIRRTELKYFRAALDEAKISKNRFYVHIGKVPSPDMLVVIADFFSHVHDIGWVIVSGRYTDKLVVIFRSDGYKKDAGKLAKKAFGELGSAGGHRQGARAEIPLKNLPADIAEGMTTAYLERFVKKHL